MKGPVTLVIQADKSVTHGTLVELEDLARQGKLPPRTKPEELADFCYSIMQGGLIVSKVRRDVRPFEHSVKHALAYVRGLIQQPPAR